MFKYDENLVESFGIYEWNANNIQQKRLQGYPKQIQLNANGHGIAFAAISCEYFLKANNSAKGYALNVGASLSSNDQIITINVGAMANTSVIGDVKGMSLIEIQLPTGYEFRYEEQMYKSLSHLGVKVIVNDHSSLGNLYLKILFTES